MRLPGEGSDFYGFAGHKALLPEALAPATWINCALVVERDSDHAAGFLEEIGAD